MSGTYLTMDMRLWCIHYQLQADTGIVLWCVI